MATLLLLPLPGKILSQVETFPDVTKFQTGSEGLFLFPSLPSGVFFQGRTSSGLLLPELPRFIVRGVFSKEMQFWALLL